MKKWNPLSSTPGEARTPLGEMEKLWLKKHFPWGGEKKKEERKSRLPDICAKNQQTL